MNYKLLSQTDRVAVTALFTESFTTAAGEEEGQLVGGLADALATSIDNTTVIAYGAYEQHSSRGELVGAIFFTQLQFEEPVQVYMLAPVAISSTHQQQGLGQGLIRYGMDAIKQRSTDWVVTYGDPAYYSKVGFEPVSEAVIKAPLSMSMPQGWQACSLKGEVTPVLESRPKCVEPFNNPVYW